MNYIFIKNFFFTAWYLADKLIPWLRQNQGIHNQNCELQSLSCWGRGVTFWCYMVGIYIIFLFGRFRRGWLLEVKPIINKTLLSILIHFGSSLFSTLNLDSILQFIVLDLRTHFQHRNDTESLKGKARIFYISFFKINSSIYNLCLHFIQSKYILKLFKKF